MRRRQQPAGLTPAEPPQAPTGPQAADPPKGLNGPAAPPEPQHGGQMNLSNVVELPEAWKNKGNIGPEEPQKPKAPPSDPEDRKVYPLGMGAEKIVESIFSMPDSGEEYDDLNRLLKLEERFTSMSSGQQLDELERCQECVMRAMRLLAVVKAMAAEQEEHIEVVLSALKREALENLQSERSALKEAKQAAKQITNDDILTEVRRIHPDELLDHTMRREKTKRMVQVVERLADAWVERGRDLRVMVGKSRSE